MGTDEPAGETAAALRAAQQSAKQLLDQANTIARSDRVRSSPWITGLVGGLLAVLAGVLVMSGVRAAALGIVTSQLTQAAGSYLNWSKYVGIFASTLDSVLPSGPLMLVTAQGASTTLKAVATVQGNPISLDVTARTGISLLVLIPIAACLLGGWVAARYGRAPTTKEAALRGALIAPAYAVAVFAVALLMPGGLSGSVNLPSLPFVGQIAAGLDLKTAPDLLTTLVSSLLFGAVFGAIGGVIAVAGSSWWQACRDLLAEIRLPLRTQAELALRALVIVLLGCLAVAAVGVVAVLSNGDVQRANVQGAVATTWFGLLPTMVVWLAGLLSGAPLVASVDAQGTSAGTWLSVTQNLTNPAWLMLIWLGFGAVLILLGWAGYTAASQRRASGLGASAIEGAAVACPWTLAFVMLLYWASVSVHASGSAVILKASAAGFAGFSSLESAFWIALWAALACGAGGVLYGLRAPEVVPVAVGPPVPSSPQQTVQPSSVVQIPAGPNGGATPVPLPGQGPQAPRTRFCGGCGQQVREGQAFCGKCGRRLG